MNTTTGHRWMWGLIGLLLLFPTVASAQQLGLPARAEDAQTGTAFIRSVVGLNLADREERILEEILRGNVPESLRTLRRVRIVSGPDTLEVWATPDYLSIGSEADHVRIPMTPQSADRISDALEMSLPTPALVDAIWTLADRKLAPSPIPPTPAMTTAPAFMQHSRTVDAQLRAGDIAYELVAGHKKDVVISRGLASAPGRVAIYGWHRLTGEPIQPLYLGHTADWVDYSHGVRLVSRCVRLNGEATDLWDVLTDPDQASLLSHEGPLARPWFARTR